MIALCLLLALLALPLRAGDVTLAWDPSPSPDAAGYNVYYGVGSRTYTNKIDVGKATSVRISGLQPTTRYYFAATAYDIAGLESDFSPEVSYDMPTGTNSVPINPTNRVFVVTAMMAPTLEGPWTPLPACSPSVVTNPPSDMFFKLATTNWVQ
jgi:hypothetical protein